MASKPHDTSDVVYTYRGIDHSKPSSNSIEVLGLDTEAYQSGRPFMVATSLGDSYHMKEWPGCLFGRKYRSKVFVAYNLKYDSGALLYHLPKTRLKQLWADGKTEYAGYKYYSIANKFLRITRTRHSITVYDMLNFYHMSLEKASNRYLGEGKLDEDTTLYTPAYVRSHWEQISAYCIRDAQLVQRLAERLIKQFESYGVYPRRLYSVAYVSYQYFKTHTKYVHVRRFWKGRREILDYAMRSYNGGKFEVTMKGCDHYYEYDIVSAYPHEIANLIDISKAEVIHDKKYRRGAAYGFLDVTIHIPINVHSPIVVPVAHTNTYPVGTYRRVITKQEYDYMIKQGCSIDIHDAYWLYVSKREYPYRKEIKRLVRLKQRVKKTGDEMDYHTIKILLNSLYGKFVQLIKKGELWHASGCWNPIYGSIITANCRIRVTDMQQQYRSVVAVHTDSVISTEPLPITPTDKLGEFTSELAGEGVLLGSGIYQIGDKIKFRGWESHKPLSELYVMRSRYAKMSVLRPHTWREVAFHNWDSGLINMFEKLPRKIDCRFDQKRIWIDDWQYWSDVPERQVLSIPLVSPLMC